MNSFNNEQVRKNAITHLQSRIPAVVFPGKDSNNDMFIVSIDFCNNDTLEQIIPLKATVSYVTDSILPSKSLEPVASVGFDIANYSAENKVMRVFAINSESETRNLCDLDSTMRTALLQQIIRFAEHLHVESIQLHSVSDRLSYAHPEQFKFSEAYHEGFSCPSESVIKNKYAPECICMTKKINEKNTSATIEENNQ